MNAKREKKRKWRDTSALGLPNVMMHRCTCCNFQKERKMAMNAYSRSLINTLVGEHTFVCRLVEAKRIVRNEILTADWLFCLVRINRKNCACVLGNIWTRASPWMLFSFRTSYIWRSVYIRPMNVWLHTSQCLDCYVNIPAMNIRRLNDFPIYTYRVYCIQIQPIKMISLEI